MSLLAVSVQFYGQPRLVTKVPAGAFYPTPKVDSAILRIETFPQLMVAEADIPRFFGLARAGFGQRRKQLRNSLAHGLGLPTALIEERLNVCALDPQRRAESLSLAEWGALLQAFEAIPLPKAPGDR
jgi:16S rRNA (adenine1518-N6/adenine1519-N6)-dimethyltransferase